MKSALTYGRGALPVQKACEEEIEGKKIRIQDQMIRRLKWPGIKKRAI